MKLPKYVTIAGLLVSVSAIFLDPTNAPLLAQLLGDHMTAKVSLAGAIMAAMGRAILGTPSTPPVTPPTEP